MTSDNTLEGNNANPPRLSDDELAKRIEYIQQVTTPPEGFDIRQVVSDAVGEYLLSRKFASQVIPQNKGADQGVTTNDTAPENRVVSFLKKFIP